MQPRILTAREAVDLIPAGSTVLTEGFVGACFAEELAVALGQRFVDTGQPRDLTLTYAAGQGDGRNRGLNHLGHEGLLKRVVGGHWNLVPRIQKLATDNKIEAYNLPQGVLTHLIRDIAAGKPGTISHVGLNTFVDPRLEGGKLNAKTSEDLVQVVVLADREWLFYKAFPIDVALLRGTWADELGNVSAEREGMTLSLRAAAQACKNSGGLVIVQVEDVVAAGSLDPRLVQIPGIYVDVLVPASHQDYHLQTFATRYNPGFCGEVRSLPLATGNLGPGLRRVIARRAAREIHQGAVVNLGIGMPEGVSMEAGRLGRDFTLTVEAGAIGGVPQGGLDFGCSLNPQAIIDMPSQFDFYQGGGLDIAFLGMAQVDTYGNVNVSKFGGRIPGCGGFVDISQNARTVVFCGSFTTDGLRVSTGRHGLSIEQEGRVKKFISQVEQVTFSGSYANKTGQKVLYVTERAVFRLTPLGLELTETAPGIDVERDILGQMELRPTIASPGKMDFELFC